MMSDPVGYVRLGSHGRLQTKGEEGLVLHAYPDPLTKGPPWTIGWGHTGVEVKAGVVWTEAQCEAAFESDFLRAEDECLEEFPWFPTLSEPRRAVLACMVFQMGMGRVRKFHDTLAAIRDGHFAHAANCMKMSVWAHQTPRRCVLLAHQIETGEWQS